MGDLPLIVFEKDRRFHRRTGLAEAIRTIDVGQLVDAYKGTVEAAPKRESFFVGHDGGGGIANLGSEKVRAKAIFNCQLPLEFANSRLRVVDYEIPLRRSLTDAGVGEIDLAAVDEASGRLWVVELKVFDNMETPLKALLQVLRYSAIVEANRELITEEFLVRFGIELQWPAVGAVAADTAYWAKMRDTKPAGEWLTALKRLAEELTLRLDLGIHFLDLGDIPAEERSDGRAYLSSPAVVTEL